MPKSVKGVMEEFEQGQLHSGSSAGPRVTNPKQAVAIALSEQRKKRGESTPGLMATRNNLRNHRQASIAHIKRGSR